MEPYRVLLLKEGGSWVAQCLDFDIAGQGQTMQDAVVDFFHTFFGEIALSNEKGKPELNGILPAPEYYWGLFREVAKPIEACGGDHLLNIDTSEIPLPFTLPETGLRCVMDYSAA